MAETYFFAKIIRLKTNSPFYKEALQSLTKLELRKGVPEVRLWDEEHIFYNPLFKLENGKTLAITKHCENKGVFKLDHLLEEKAKESRNLPFDKVLTKLFDKIILSTEVRKEDIMITISRDEVKFTEITHRKLYEETLMQMYRDHYHQVKWFENYKYQLTGSRFGKQFITPCHPIKQKLRYGSRYI